MKGKTFQIIGYLLFAFLMYLGAKWITKNKPSEKETEQYIKNSSAIIVKTPQIISTKDHVSYSWLSDFFNAKNSNAEGKYKNIAVIKDGATNKYYKIEVFHSNIFLYDRTLTSENLTIKVNKELLSNPKYGTEENPYLVLYIKPQGTAIMTEEDYKYGVSEYLTYEYKK